MRDAICTVHGCERPRVARGLCGAHYQRQVKYGDPGCATISQRVKGSTYARWAAKVARGSQVDCWEWLGSRNDRGYGKLYRSGRLVYAHRFAYEHFIGPIPSGLEIDHLCRNRGCVNPSHLRIVTRKQNTENAAARRDATSGYRGVSFSKRRAGWYVRVMHNRRTFYGGMFETAEEANSAAIELRNRLFTHNEMDK